MKNAPHSNPVRRASGCFVRSRFLCLVVDDGANNQHALAELIEDDDLDVVTAGGVPEALRVLHERRVDLVVTEEYLPGASGSELLETVRARWPNVGRVLIGRELGADVIVRAVNRARVQRVLHKKMSAQSLRAEIDAALNETLLERDVRTSQRAAANE
jgi:DNA-binding NtrC family response regulator